MVCETKSELGYTHLTDYVNSNGGRNRSKQQCQDKLGYFVQTAKKKVGIFTGDTKTILF